MKNKDILVYWFIPVFCVFLFHSCNSSDQNQEEQVSVPADPAISNITQKIKESPDDPSLYIARASILFEKEGYDQAITDLNQAIALDSLSIEAHHLLADVYLKYFRSNNAIKTLEKIVELQPDDQASLLKLAQFQLFLKQNESAIQSLNKTLQLNPQNPEAFFLLGQCFKEMGDTSRAINSFQQAVELDPEIIDGWINLGQLNAALGNKIAAQYFESGLAVAPDNLNLMHAKAFYLADQEKLEEAIEVYRSMIRKDPQYEQSYLNLGMLYLDQDSIEMAKKQFDMLIKISPLHIRAYYFRGVSQELSGNNDAALADYRQAVKLAPNFEAAIQGINRLEEVN